MAPLTIRAPEFVPEKKKIEELEVVLISFQEQLSIEQKTVARINKEKAFWNAQSLLTKVECSEAIQDKEDAIGKLQNADEQLRKEKDQLRKENEQLRKEKEQLRKSLKTSNKICGELKKKLDDTHIHAATQEKVIIEETKKKLDDARIHAETQETKLDEAHEEVKQTVKKLDHSREMLKIMAIHNGSVDKKLYQVHHLFVKGPPEQDFTLSFVSTFSSNRTLIELQHARLVWEGTNFTPWKTDTHGNIPVIGTGSTISTEGLSDIERNILVVKLNECKVNVTMSHVPIFTDYLTMMRSNEARKHQLQRALSAVFGKDDVWEIVGRIWFCSDVACIPVTQALAYKLFYGYLKCEKRVNNIIKLITYLTASKAAIIPYDDENVARMVTLMLTERNKKHRFMVSLDTTWNRLEF